MVKLFYPELEKAKPMIRHALVQGILSLIAILFLASRPSWDFASKTTTSILNLVGMKTNYVSPSLLLDVRLLDGTIASFEVLIECSGLVTVAIFSFIYTFTVGLLKGSILKKTCWFLVSLGVYMACNINRLAFLTIVAHNFGLPIFSFTHYLLSPFIDFLWVVTMWSLGMSWLKGGTEP